ncbi:unnamed protein product [Gadus morhua 'NCC']
MQVVSATTKEHGYRLKPNIKTYCRVGLTPAEDLALALNRGRPLKQELVDPPQEDVFGQQEVEQMFTLDEPDEEASSAVTDVSDSIPETRRAAGQNEDVKAIYKRHLLLDIEYKRLKMRKVQLEIKKLEKELREDY